MGTTKRLADFIAQTSFDQLPKDVIEQTKWILFDSIGCSLGGYALDNIYKVKELVEEWGGNPQCSIIGDKASSSYVASFMNGALLNALDWDLIGPITAHVANYVTPACWAVSELVAASGKDLILALALAHEIGGRIGNSLSQTRIPKKEPPFYEKADRYSYAHTVFGGTAGACRLLKMPSDKIVHALGMTGNSVPVAGQVKEKTETESPMWKYANWCAWVAPIATTTALLAQKGFTSDPAILDGEWGFWKMYGSAFFHENVIFDGLGEKWHVVDVEFKPYPACRCNHGAYDGINKIITENKIQPNEIEEILVQGDAWLQVPLRSGKEIRSECDTQFCVAYGFANAVINGRNPSPEWQKPSTYNNPIIKELMKKVKVAMHPQGESILAGKVQRGEFPLYWDSRVEIKARGRTFVADIPEANVKGSRANPMTIDELIRKFDLNASYSVIPKKKIEKAKDLILGLDKVSNVKELFSCLVI